MKRWDADQMREVGEKLFAKIHRQKYHAHHNHEIHVMAREMDEWLPQGIQALLEGTYDPRCLKRYYFSDEVVDQPIDAPRGYKNPIKGIALRGPLSQFFSGIYLKPLDDAFLNTSVHYFRFQDDVLILCKTKRQMNRCRRRLMEVLSER